MNELAVKIGQRLKSYRLKDRLSQEKLAELAGCHPTYIGQIERGEKNATIESIERISSALNISLSELFKSIGTTSPKDEIPSKCYDIILSKSRSQQEHIYKILLEIETLTDI